MQAQAGTFSKAIGFYHGVFDGDVAVTETEKEGDAALMSSGRCYLVCVCVGGGWWLAFAGLGRCPPVADVPGDGRQGFATVLPISLFFCFFLILLLLLLR